MGKRQNRKEKEGVQEEEEPAKILKVTDILVQGVATSIDALCIGFVCLDQSIPQAMTIFSIIGGVTMALSFLTTLLGKKIGKWLSEWAGLIAGLIFLGTGLKILLTGIL